MACDRKLWIEPPVHYIDRIGLDTEIKLREAVESVARRLIVKSTEGFEEHDEMRWYAWIASPTFNDFAKDRVVITSTCLRFETIFLGYAYAIWTINGTHEELRELVLRRSKAGTNPLIRTDYSDLEKIVDRLHFAYLVLTDIVKGNLLLWNRRSHPYESAEYYIETTNVLINICVALHTLAFVEFGQSDKNKINNSTWARLFLFIAIRFERAYFLLSSFVWLMYGGTHPTATALQRVCMGYILYYRAKTYIMCILTIISDPKKDIRMDRPYSSLEMILAFAQRCVWLCTPLVRNIHFGFQSRAKKLLEYAEKTIRQSYIAVPKTSISRKTIESEEDYNNLEHIISFIITDGQSKHMLAVMAKSRNGFRFVPNFDYGNYNGFEHFSLRMPDL